VSDLLVVLKAIDDPLGSRIAGQALDCLHRMDEVGLGYLSLSRRTDTLSGGELQRLKMVRHLGSSLSNITYIFDEPTAGLHPADAQRISSLLCALRDRHNTVLVVEHSRQIIELADHIIELGPRAGADGGRLVFEGSPDKLKQQDTATAKAMRKHLEVNPAPRRWNKCFRIEHANSHNLKDLSVNIPKNVLTVVTGVAGSGKSTLVCGELASRCPDAILLNQRPVNVSSRSTPATYTGIMDDIRKSFAAANHVSAQWFSFNSKGACPVCKGKGEILPDVAFADPVAVLCEECGGKRYNPTALHYLYRGLNIDQVMRLTVSQALDFFTQPRIRERLALLEDVGLGYLTLGQPTSTLSGGETQRLKLAEELNRRGKVYLLDEPSAGLHHEDIRRLLDLLQRLAAQGNTVVVAEHRLEIVAVADWVIDLGPAGGKDGGRLVFEGTPQQLTECPVSQTGKYLRAYT